MLLSHLELVWIPNLARRRRDAAAKLLQRAATEAEALTLL